MLVIVDLAVDALIGIAGRVTTIHRVIKAIGKHVIAEDTLAGRSEGVGIQESAHFWVIIFALEIIQPGFGIFELAPVPTCHENRWALVRY